MLIDIWVCRHTDCEGRRDTGLAAIFDNKEDAEAFQKKQRFVSVWKEKGISAGGAGIYIVTSGPHLMNVDFEKQKREVKEAALAKLTPEEKTILGLK